MEIVIGFIGAIVGFKLYDFATRLGNSNIIYTLLTGVAVIFPWLGVPALISLFFYDLILNRVLEAGVFAAVVGKGHSSSVKISSSVLGLLGITAGVCFAFGVTLSWFSFGNVTSLITLYLIAMNIREGFISRGAGQAITETLILLVLALLTIQIGNLSGVNNLIAIVCVIFGLLPGGKSVQGTKKVSRYEREDTGGALEEFRYLGVSTALAVGGVNPYLLLNGSIGVKNSLVVCIVAELVPLAKWMCGQDTGKTFLTELLKSQSIVPGSTEVIITAIILVSILFIISAVLNQVLIKRVQDFVEGVELSDKKASFIGDMLIVFFLGVSSGIIPALIAIGMFLIFRSNDGAIIKLLPPNLVTSLPISVIVFS